MYTGTQTEILLVVSPPHPLPFNVYLHSSAFTDIIALCRRQFLLLDKRLNSDSRYWPFRLFWNIFSFGSIHVENLQLKAFCVANSSLAILTSH